jgi:hypothetical protein
VEIHCAADMLGEALLMNRNLKIWAGVAMWMATAGVCSADEVFPVVHPEPITVRVVDGKGGKPQARVHVVLVAGYDRHDLRQGLWREEAVTDAEGKVRISGALRNLPLLRVEVLKRHACATGIDEEVIAVERIRLAGLSGANRCGFAPIEDAPGVFTAFVKGKKASAKGVGALAKPAAPETVEQAKSEALTKEPAPVPLLTDFEVAQMQLEQN